MCAARNTLDPSQCATERPEVSVVIPLFNEEANVYELLAAVSETLALACSSHEIILVDDGSTDTTWSKIKHACGTDTRIRGLLLARNYGHQRALLAGLHRAAGRAVISMDGDLQHPPQMIPQLLDAWRQGSLIVATRRKYTCTIDPLKRLGSRCFYRIFSCASGIRLDDGSSDFRLIDAEVLRYVRSTHGDKVFLRGLVATLGFPCTTLNYTAGKRYAGKTKFGFREMIHLAGEALASFWETALRRRVWAAAAATLCASAAFAQLSLRYPAEYFDSVYMLAAAGCLLTIGLGIALLAIVLARIRARMRACPLFAITASAGFAEPHLPAAGPRTSRRHRATDAPAYPKNGPLG